MIKLINGYAGCGKTTSILKESKKFKLGSKNLFLSFNKSIVKEFSTKLNSDWECKTLHSMATKVLKSKIDYSIDINKYNIGLSSKYSLTVLDSLNTVGYVDFNYCKTKLKKSFEDFKYKFTNITPKTISFDEVFGILHLNGIKDFQTYDNIFVDEFQDLTLGMLLFIQSFKYKNLTFTGDSNQNIYQFKGTLNNTIKTISTLFVIDKIEYLNNSYRLSSDMCELVNGMVNFSPKIFSNKNTKNSIVYIQQAGTTLCKSSDLTILCRTNAECRELKANPLYTKADIRTIHSVKGLEFSKVAVHNINKLALGNSTIDNNLLYVALTRALNVLYIL